MNATIIEGEIQSEDVDFVLDVATLRDDLLVKLDRMRSVDPIYWSEKNQVWLVTGHAEVVEGFKGKLPLSSVRLHIPIAHIPEEVRYERFPFYMEAVKSWLLNIDGPEHQRQRLLMMRAFSKPVVETIRPSVVQYIEEALDDAGKIDEPFDFVSRIARVIPARMILKQLGLQDTLISKLHHWAVTLNQQGNVRIPVEVAEEINDVLLEMRDVFDPELEKRRKMPTDDFLSALVSASESGDTLTKEEMFGICVITLIAGHDTTANTMALGTALLRKDCAISQAFRGDPARVPDAVMELQRRVAMSMMMGRIASEDFHWNGHEIKKGQVVMLAQGAANRDPAVFNNPQATDVTRQQTHNMTFAPGVHHCIGFMLAKMVLGEFFPRFLKRFDVDVLDDALDFAPTASFRGLNSLKIKLHARDA
ncbi:cytochrome P450 [Paraburkholderia sp. J67]|uniref:cytochrome P450 n=1 Tax=Paraburkholderia sp. J67 TaxID=2805435 RepID=UPI002ABD9E9F|nr:cytochrome P450 [Paraburkholderia sp. J67]